VDVETRRFWNGISWVEIDPATGELVNRPLGGTGASAGRSTSAPVLAAPVLAILERPRVAPPLVTGPRSSPEPSTPYRPAPARTVVEPRRRSADRMPSHRAVPGPARRIARAGAVIAVAAGAGSGLIGLAAVLGLPAPF
jgi:hypothetical protein